MKSSLINLEQSTPSAYLDRFQSSFDVVQLLFVQAYLIFNLTDLRGIMIETLRTLSIEIFLRGLSREEQRRVPVARTRLDVLRVV